MNQVGHRVIISVTATVTQWSLLEKPFQENLRPSLRRLVYSVITCILHCYCYQDDCSTIACKLLYDSIIQRVNNEYRTTCISKADFAGEPHKHKQTSLNGWEYLCGSHSHELCATNARWRHYCSVCTILRQVLHSRFKSRVSSGLERRAKQMHVRFWSTNLAKFETVGHTIGRNDAMRANHGYKCSQYKE